MGKELTEIDLWNEVVRPSILEQYRGKTLTDEQVAEWGCSNRWQACLKSIVDKVQNLDDAACKLPTFLDFSTMPAGKQLDWIAGLTNKIRKDGESDEDLFSRFIAGLGRGKVGSVPILIESVKRLSKDNDPGYFEESDATFFETSFRGDQLSRAQVALFSPAGVLGLPAAMMCDGGLNPMATYDGTLMCCVARDENIGKIYEEVLEIGGLRYKTVKIGNQEWMAENLQLEVPDSWFINDDEATYGRNGKNYGRLYTWDAAMKIVVPGWHIPSRAEWEQLANFAGGYTVAGTKLMSRSLGGTDDFGFNSYLCGMKSVDYGDVYYEGTESDFISSSSTGRYSFDGMSLSNSRFLAEDFGKSYAYSVRLVKD